MPNVSRGFDRAIAKQLRIRGHSGEKARLGLTYAQAASAARDNVFLSHVPLAELEKLVLDYILETYDGVDRQVRQRIRRYARQFRRGLFETVMTVPRLAVSPTTTPRDIIQHRLSPTSNTTVVDELEKPLGLINADRVPDGLAALDGLAPGVSQIILNGDIGSAINQLRGKPVNPETLRNILVTAAKYRVIATAHARMAGLGAVTAKPFGRGRLAGQKGPSAGTSFLAMVARPSMVVQAFGERALDDTNAAGVNLVARVVPDPANEPLVGMGLRLLERLGLPSTGPVPAPLRNALAVARHDTWPYAMMVKGDMILNGMSDLEPVEYMIRLRGNEVACFVAEQVLIACADVEAAIAAKMGLPALPSVRSPVSPARVGHLAAILRYEARSDRYAPGFRPRKSAPANPLDPLSHLMLKTVAATRRKLEDRMLRQRLTKAFGIDGPALLAAF